MQKAMITSLKAMNEEQIREDVSMTPLERLRIAFQLSDFALELNSRQETIQEDPGRIKWIVLHKRTARP